MARLNRNKKPHEPGKSRIHWLIKVNTILILGLYALTLLEKLGWIG